MKLLVTSARMPYALAEIRAFGREGHVVYTADTFHRAPGNHSDHAIESFETVSPRADPRGYFNQIGMLAQLHDIDLVVPTFEEVFYLARFGSTVGTQDTPVFSASFDTLRLLHDKASFSDLTRELDLDVATTHVCTAREELQEATRRHERFFCRAAFSRAGSSIYTNAGPLAGQTSIDDICPSSENPWIVQPYIEGDDLCTFSVVHGGHVVAHSAYRHPKTLDSAGGIVFESIRNEAALEAAQRIAEATAYRGQLSLDMITTEDGRLYMVECNPRATAGVCVMPPAMFVESVLHPRTDRGPYIAPAGIRRSIRSALLREAVVEPSNAIENLAEILSDTPDVYFDANDPAPGLYQFLSLTHVLQHWRSNKGSADDRLAASYLHDVCWDGEALEPDKPLADTG